MGLDVPAIKLLCCAKNVGADFSETLMVGRQKINAGPASIEPILSAVGISAAHSLALRESEFGEQIFKLLGARNVSSLDVSSYENATHVHDMNLPLPEALSERFSLVYDGGTLEHVFNLPQALKNCMQMVRVGGYFAQCTVANNYMGHGFWQLSPDIMYGALSAENGFEIKAVLLHEVIPRGGWYVVSDPSICRSRVELCNRNPTYICTIAKRVARAEIFASAPQQIYWTKQWVRPRDKIAGGTLTLRSLIPKPVKRMLRAGQKVLMLAPSPFAQPYYRRIADRNLIMGRI